MTKWNHMDQNIPFFLKPHNLQDLRYMYLYITGRYLKYEERLVGTEA